MPDPLDAVSPLDGRYAAETAPLRSLVSEAGLMRERTRVEIEYLIALADLEAVPLSLDADERAACRAVYEGFDADDARLIKRIETEGVGDIEATNHDVKAVEYFVRERLSDGLDRVHPWIHFGLTSEDVTNVAYRLIVRAAVDDVLAPTLDGVRADLADLARAHRGTPMLARTHGQPATPTTFGKELAVFAARLDAGGERLDDAVGSLAGKFGGASGTYAAHVVALPDVDWRAFSRAFLADLGLDHAALTTQVNPGDDLAACFEALRGINRVLVDLARDLWLYVADGSVVQRAEAGEVGSSTMPHKVNPIDFENAEGNLGKANADLAFLADSITTSRLQRDLTDSTVKRNVGVALGHCLLGYSKVRAGLGKVAPDEAAMRAGLEAAPAVLAEAVQTVLRREGHADAYERVKALTRGHELDLADLRAAIDDLDVDADVRDELRALTPAAYTGIAAELVDELE